MGRDMVERGRDCCNVFFFDCVSCVAQGMDMARRLYTSWHLLTTFVPLLVLNQLQLDPISSTALGHLQTMPHPTTALSGPHASKNVPPKVIMLCLERPLTIESPWLHTTSRLSMVTSRSEASLVSYYGML